MTCPWGDLEEGIVRKNEFRILNEDGELKGHRRVPPPRFDRYEQTQKFWIS